MKPEKNKRKEKFVSNNIVALLGIAFALISLVGNIIVYKETEKLIPQGYAVHQAYASLTIIGTEPDVNVVFPDMCSVVGELTTINATVTDAQGDATIVNATFWWYKSGLGYNYVGFDVWDGDTNYDTIWNTSSVPDGYFYLARARATDINLLEGEDISNGYFFINNIDEEPDWTAFKYPVSTNLTALANASSLGEWTFVDDLRLGNQHGMINFSGQTQTVDGLNLSQYINITFARIEMDSSVYECMDKPAYLHFFGVNMSSPRILRGGTDCPGAICTLISNDYTDVVVRVTSWTYYEVTESAVLSIWDVTDKDVYNGNQSRHKRELTQFYANLTAGGIPVNDSYISCWIQFNTSTIDEYDEMEFKVSNLYEHQRQFNRPGIYQWNVTCNSTLSQYFYYFANDTVNISNRPPRITSLLPNITMEEDRILHYVDLDDYFVDPDGDRISYNASYVPNIEIEIDNSNFVFITPDENWFGNRSFWITATDEFGMSNQSNTIYITVTDVPEPTSDADTGEGGGGGGGGYTEYEYLERPDCIDKWECSAWSSCQYRWPDIDVDVINENDGIRSRTCTDVNECNYWWKKPNETMYCTYQPTCSDLIKNQEEEKVDCGGQNCPPCPTCDDGIQNQNETSVDCGGPCPTCPSCFDGFQNQEEEGVDCGGPCKTCVTIERPDVMFDWIMAGLMVLMLSVLFFTMYIFVKPYIVRISLNIMALRDKLLKEEIPEKSLLDLEAETIAKLDKLLRKLEKGKLDDVLKEFTDVFREFIKVSLKIKYEFTYEELQEELKKQKMPGLLKIALTNFTGELVQIQYGKRKLTKDLLRDEINKAKEIVHQVVKHLPREEVTKEVKPSVPREHLRKVYKIMVEVNKALAKKDIKTATKSYQHINELYEKLPKNQQKEIHHRIRRLKKALEAAKKNG